MTTIDIKPQPGKEDSFIQDLMLRARHVLLMDQEAKKDASAGFRGDKEHLKRYLEKIGAKDITPDGGKPFDGSNGAEFQKSYDLDFAKRVANTLKSSTSVDALLLYLSSKALENAATISEKGRIQSVTLDLSDAGQVLAQIDAYKSQAWFSGALTPQQKNSLDYVRSLYTNLGRADKGTPLAVKADQKDSVYNMLTTDIADQALALGEKVAAARNGDWQTTDVTELKELRARHVGLTTARPNTLQSLALKNVGAMLTYLEGAQELNLASRAQMGLTDQAQIAAAQKSINDAKTKMADPAVYFYEGEIENEGELLDVKTIVGGYHSRAIGSLTGKSSDDGGWNIDDEQGVAKSIEDLRKAAREEKANATGTPGSPGYQGGGGAGQRSAGGGSTGGGTSQQDGNLGGRAWDGITGALGDGTRALSVDSNTGIDRRINGLMDWFGDAAGGLGDISKNTYRGMSKGAKAFWVGIAGAVGGAFGLRALGNQLGIGKWPGVSTLLSLAGVWFGFLGLRKFAHGQAADGPDYRAPSAYVAQGLADRGDIGLIHKGGNYYQATGAPRIDPNSVDAPAAGAGATPAVPPAAVNTQSHAGGTLGTNLLTVATPSTGDLKLDDVIKDGNAAEKEASRQFVSLGSTKHLPLEFRIPEGTEIRVENLPHSTTADASNARVFDLEALRARKEMAPVARPGFRYNDIAAIGLDVG